MTHRSVQASRTWPGRRERQREAGRASAARSAALDMYTEDVPELHHAAAETVSDLLLDPDEDDETGELPVDLP